MKTIRQLIDILQTLFHPGGVEVDQVRGAESNVLYVDNAADEQDGAVFPMTEDLVGPQETRLLLHKLSLGKVTEKTKWGILDDAPHGSKSGYIIHVNRAAKPYNEWSMVAMKLSNGELGDCFWSFGFKPNGMLDGILQIFCDLNETRDPNSFKSTAPPITHYPSDDYGTQERSQAFCRDLLCQLRGLYNDNPIPLSSKDVEFGLTY